METKKNKNIQGCWFELMMNPHGELVLIMDAFDMEPEMPRLVYDGGDRMIFYRNRDICRTLSGLDPEQAGKYIMSARKMTIAETDEDDIVREYEADVRIVTSLAPLFEE